MINLKPLIPRLGDNKNNIKDKKSISTSSIITNTNSTKSNIIKP